MRFSITFILLTCTLLVMAQNSTISEGEKSRLENQFKALKTYYINDDGLVVYQKQSSGNNQNANEENKVEKTASENNTKTKQVTDKQASSFVINKRPTDPNTITKNKVVQTSKSSTSAHVETPVINKTPTKTTTNSPKVEGGLRKEEQVQKKVETKSEIASTPAKEQKNATDVVETKTTGGVKKTKGTYPYRKLELSSAPLKYKDMEEAAMAVDNLLDKLKKEQAQNANHRSGSMSTKIARGAGKSTFRKETISDRETINDMGMGETYDSLNNNNSLDDSQDYENYNDNEDLDVDVPTYYINGYEVDRSEVDKIKKRDIISRQVRIRNTISGNPAGEVWLEVKDSKL